MEKVPEVVSNNGSGNEANEEWLPLTRNENVFVWISIICGQVALGLLIYFF